MNKERIELGDAEKFERSGSNDLSHPHSNLPPFQHSNIPPFEHSNIRTFEHSNILSRAHEVFDVEIEGLKAVRDSIGETFVKAVELLSSTVKNGGIVVVSGVGKSLHVAEKMSGIFSSTGTRSTVLNPVQAMHGDLGLVSSRDVLVALSFSGESEEIVRLIPAVRRHGLKVVSLTGNEDSTLAKLSDIHLHIPCGREACPFGMAPTNSATATMVMGDALAMVLVERQKFAIEDYAMNHPAGAIGRALVMKVTDIMRTGERLAVVSPESTVMDAVMAMTKAQSGSAVVADEDGKLVGIFTDGDFRRMMGKCLTSEHSNIQTFEHSNIQTFPHSNIQTFMTASPLFVYDDVYAAELLKIFERRHIDDLPVCDREGRVVGIVDIQDLPKMKVI